MKKQYLKREYSYKKIYSALMIIFFLTVFSTTSYTMNFQEFTSNGIVKDVELKKAINNELNKQILEKNKEIESKTAQENNESISNKNETGNTRNNLEKKSLRSNIEEITSEDIKLITELDASNRNIKELSGLERAINLKKINLEGNKIKDISPLGEITNLTDINVQNQKISLNDNPLILNTNTIDNPLRDLKNKIVSNIEGENILAESNKFIVLQNTESKDIDLKIKFSKDEDIGIFSGEITQKITYSNNQEKNKTDWTSVYANNIDMRNSFDLKGFSSADANPNASVFDVANFVNVTQNKLSLGNYNYATNSGRAMQTSYLQSKFKVDFNKSFELKGRLLMPPTPDGLTFGFSNDNFSPGNTGRGGAMGIYNHNNNSHSAIKSAIIYELDTINNGNTLNDSGLGNKHVALQTTNSSGGLDPITDYRNLNFTSPQNGNVHILYNSDTKILTMEWNGYKFTYTNPMSKLNANEAYFFMSGSMRPSSGVGYGTAELSVSEFNYLNEDLEVSTEYSVLRNGSPIIISSSDISSYARPGEEVTVKHKVNNKISTSYDYFTKISIPSLKYGTQNISIIPGSASYYDDSNNKTGIVDNIFNSNNNTNFPTLKNKAPSYLEYKVKLPDVITSNNDLTSTILLGEKGMTQSSFNSIGKVAGIPTLTIDKSSELVTTGIVDLRNGLVGRTYDGNNVNLTTDTTDLELTSNPTNIDSSNIGTHVVSYILKDKRTGLTTTGTKTFIIKSGPIISGTNQKTIFIGDNFDPMAGVTSVDDAGNPLTINLSGSVNTGIAGEYKLKYTSTNKDGITTVKDRIIKVIYNQINVTGQNISGNSNKFKINIEGNNVLKVIDQIKNQLSPDIASDTYLTIQIYSSTGVLKTEVTLNGVDSGTSPKLDNLNNFKYEFGDIIRLTSSETNPANSLELRGPIAPDRDNWKGSFTPDNHDNSVFEITNKGLRQLYNEAPVINNVTDIEAVQGKSFNELLNITATDDRNDNGDLHIGYDLTSKIKNISKTSLNFDIPGTYNRTYEVTDSWGRKTTQTRTITVKPLIDFVMIPSVIDLSDLNDGSDMVGTTETIEMIPSSLLPTSKFNISSNPIVELSDGTSIVGVQVYKEDNTKLKLDEDLAELDGSNMTTSFSLKTPKNNFKSIAKYTGPMNFVIKYTH